MNLYNLYDLSYDELKPREYDFIFCFSGYEERSTHVISQISLDKACIPIVFASEDTRENKIRQSCDKYYLDNFVSEIYNLDGLDDYSYIYKLMRDRKKRNRELKIFIDYSSMQRTIYTALLNWARYQEYYDSIQIDFVYASGFYPNNHVPMTINRILALPGFEGNSYKRKQSILLFGLGFEGLAAECVLDRLEPDLIFTYLANPAANSDAYGDSIKFNGNILGMAGLKLEFPLSSVEDGFRSLSELINQYVKDCRLTMVPMGPKPHVLMSILLCIRYPSITCLHVSGREKSEENVSPTGELVCTRVNFNLQTASE